MQNYQIHSSNTQNPWKLHSIKHKHTKIRKKNIPGKFRRNYQNNPTVAAESSNLTNMLSRINSCSFRFQTKAEPFGKPETCSVGDHILQEPLQTWGARRFTEDRWYTIATLAKNWHLGFHLWYFVSKAHYCVVRFLYCFWSRFADNISFKRHHSLFLLEWENTSNCAPHNTYTPISVTYTNFLVKFRFVTLKCTLLKYPQFLKKHPCR